MRIILGVLAADAGTVTWRGAPLEPAARRTFGYMPEERGLYPKMAIADQLVYFGRLYGLDAATAKRRASSYLEQLGLGDRARDRLEALSLGNQQRVQLAAALVHDPQLLVLDEPFSGLDPVAVANVAGMLQEQAAAGVPVLFSSHQLDLVERICDDVVIIDRGIVLAAGSAQQLRLDRAGARFGLQVDGASSDGVAAHLRTQQQVETVTVAAPGELLVDVRSLDADQALLRAALDHGPVRGFERVIPSLAEIFQEAVR
jgi:ABC-2 type transport system ATP-binding protein